MIKLGIKHNLSYPYMLIFYELLRKIITILLEKFELVFPLLLTQIMFLSEIIAGLSLYKYQNKIFKQLKIDKETTKTPRDNKIKIYLLIFAISLLDFIEFILNYIPYNNYLNLYNKIDINLSSIAIIFSSFFSYLILKIPIYRHQKLSLIVISFFLILSLILQSWFLIGEINGKDFLISLGLMLVHNLFLIYICIIEKYLVEYDFVNPLKMLMIEGLFGFLLSFFLYFLENPLSQIYIIKEEKTYKIIIFIIGTIIFFFLSGAYNTYNEITNKIFSPNTLALAQIVLCPLSIVYDYINEKKYKYKLYIFLINFVFSIFFVFNGCVYNEIFILFFCNLEKDTHYGVTIRASKEMLFENKVNQRYESLYEIEKDYIIDINDRI